MWSVLRLTLIPRLWLKRDKWQRFQRYVRALLYLFNIHTLMLGALSCLAVYLCDKYRFSYNMDLTLVATGTTFPLVFNIQQAFMRRERALGLIANLKASAVALYFQHRDWAQDESFPSSLGNDHTASALHCKLLLMDLLRDVRAYLVAESPFESYAEARLAAKHNTYANMIMADLSLSGGSQLSFQAAVESAQKQDPATAALRRCYRGFSRLSVLNERLGLRCGYTKGGEGGMSRTNQYLRYIISNLEELRMIRDYRTPVMMRYANACLLHIFAIVLAPYFCHFCDSWLNIGHNRITCPAGYSAAIVFTIIVMLLFNVQQDIELPFDMDGLDDVFFDVGDEILDDVMECQAGSTAAPSGFSTPRHLSDPMHCSSGPLGPTARGPADLHVSPPWMGLGPSAACQTTVRQGSVLKPVAEEGDLRDSLSAGFGSITSSAASLVQRTNSKEVLEAETQAWLNKQLQQQQHGPHQAEEQIQHQHQQHLHNTGHSGSRFIAPASIRAAVATTAAAAGEQRDPGCCFALNGQCEETPGGVAPNRTTYSGFSCQCINMDTTAGPPTGQGIELARAPQHDGVVRHVTFSTSTDDGAAAAAREQQHGPADRVSSSSSSGGTSDEDQQQLIRSGLHSSTSLSWR